MSTSGEGWYADPHDVRRLRWWTGSEWTERTAPRVDTTHWGPPLERSWTRVGIALQIALAAYVAAASFTLWVALETLDFVEAVQFRADSLAVAEGERIDSLTLWTLMEFPTYLVAGVLFIVWLYTLHRSDRMDRRTLQHTSGWAIGGWFVPILNFWRPFQMVNDVRRGATGRQSAGATTTQGWWWGIWLASTVATAAVSQLYSRAATKEDVTEYFDALADAASWERVSSWLNIVAAVLAIMVVRQVNALVRNPVSQELD